LDPEAKLALARRILFDETYTKNKEKIMRPLSEFQETMNRRAFEDREAAIATAERAETILVALAFVIPLGMGLVLWLFHTQVGRVVGRLTESVRGRDSADLTFRLEPAGTRELRDLAHAFNAERDLLANTIRGIVESSTALASSSEELSAV